MQGDRLWVDIFKYVPQIQSSPRFRSTLIQDGINGILVDFFSPEQISRRITEALENAEDMKTLRIKARETIIEKYALAKLLPQHLAWIKEKIKKIQA